MLAGAGSGKTRVIAHKIAHLIDKAGIAPAEIAAITFTNKAAKEMRARVEPLLKRSGRQRPWISTFHTLGLRILKQECAALGYRPRLTIFDSKDSEAVLADIARREIGSTDFEVYALQQRISAWKNGLQSPADVRRLLDHDPVGRIAAACYEPYVTTLKAYNAVDFDDLIMLPVQLLQADAMVLERWQKQIQGLLVDEYQDTNQGQYELVRLLAQGHGRLTVVGDDDQSIYAWRGARPENLLRLQEDFPTLKLVKLEQNYRSMGTILKAANDLIAHNPHVFEKRLWSDRGFGDRIRVIPAKDEYDETEKIANQITHQRLVKGTAYRDYAILFRGNHQARLFEHALRERNIPYVLSGSRSFFDAAEIKDAICYLRLLANPHDDNAFLRVVNSPRRGIGTGTIEQLVKVAGAHELSLVAACTSQEFQGATSARTLKQTVLFAEWLQRLHQTTEDVRPAELLKTVLSDTDYKEWLAQTSDTPQAAERRVNNLDELIAWVTRLQDQAEGRDLSDVIAALTLFDIMERADSEETGDKLSLMTLHAAKGLEFPHVFLVGFEENILPHRNSIDGETIEEERRLAYVGITRAQRSLTLSFARTRRRYGQVEACEPSRFLAELSHDDLQWEGEPQAGGPDRQVGRDTLSSLKNLLKSS